MKKIQSTRNALKFAILILLGIWMTVAAVNNLTDSATNIGNIEDTISMRLLKENSLASGLIWRALPAALAEPILYVVCVFQVFVSIMIWRAAYYFAKGLLSKDVTISRHAICCVNHALLFFIFHWGIFLCGGLWFGYWIKQGAIQMVHMTLLVIGIGVYVLFNHSENDFSEDSI